MIDPTLWNPSDVKRELRLPNVSTAAAMWGRVGFPGIEDEVLGKVVVPDDLRKWVRELVARKAHERAEEVEAERPAPTRTGTRRATDLLRA